MARFIDTTFNFSNGVFVFCSAKYYQMPFYIILTEVIEIFIFGMLWMKKYQMLTHWGRVTHICVGNLTIIGSDNGLSPDRRQAITWTNVGQLLIGPLGTNYSEMLIEIHIFSFKKIYLKMSSGKWRPFCLGLNVLSYWGRVADTCVSKLGLFGEKLLSEPIVLRLCVCSVYNFSVTINGMIYTQYILLLHMMVMKIPLKNFRMVSVLIL